MSDNPFMPSPKKIGKKSAKKARFLQKIHAKIDRIFEDGLSPPFRTKLKIKCFDCKEKRVFVRYYDLLKFEVWCKACGAIHMENK